MDFEVNSTERIHEVNAGEAGSDDDDGVELGFKVEDEKL